MTVRNTSMAGVGLIAAACLLSLAQAAAQTSPASPIPGDGPAQVMRVQQDLNDNGFSLPVNGVMGPQTVAALRTYQQQHGLPPTGRIDAQTFTSLEGIAPPTEEEAGSVQPVVPGMAQPSAQAAPGLAPQP